ncbi:hypothetical protein PZE20_25280, partial [Escherichia coli]|nr:hypothetical protein [Escherichia coli]
RTNQVIIILTCGEGRVKSLQPWLSGTARQPFFASPQVRKLFFGNAIKRLIGKTDYVRTPENPATPAFDTRQPLKAPR